MLTSNIITKLTETLDVMLRSWGNSVLIERFFFFFQAEDGIRDIGVTGVQTCALPIYESGQRSRAASRRCLSPLSPGLSSAAADPRRMATRRDAGTGTGRRANHTRPR